MQEQEKELAARTAAARIVGKVMKSAFFDVAAGDETRELSQQDSAFARMLSLTAIRHMGEAEAIMKNLMKKPPGYGQEEIRIVIALGIAQIAYMNVKHHAAVDTAVSMASPKYKPLVNAVLRRFIREREAVEVKNPALNFQKWLYFNWVRNYGEAAAGLIAACSLMEPPLDITVSGDLREWAEKLGGIAIPPCTVRLANAGKIEALPGFAEGKWWVQDISATLPARLLGDVSGKRVLDMCAAPGGKTAQLALVGAKVTALDKSPARMEILRANLARLKLSAETLVADALGFEPAEKFDAVLLDAPCSATGTIRRNPDLLYRRKKDDLKEMAKLQMRLLPKALSLVKPGGAVVYSTCSLEKREGEDILAGRDLWPITPAEIPGFENCLTERGEIRVMPYQFKELGGSDGFYMGRIKVG